MFDTEMGDFNEFESYDSGNMGSYDSGNIGSYGMSSDEYLDKLWIKEFKDMLDVRKTRFPVPPLLTQIALPKNILDIKLPMYTYCTIKGVTETPYDKLNGKLCELWEKDKGLIKTLRKPVINKTTNEYLKNNRGQTITKEYKIPTGSSAILSTENLNIRMEDSHEGFDFVDMYIHPETQTVYRIYVVPNNYIYEVNNTALILTYSDHRNKNAYYTGIEVVMQNGYRMCLQCVPYPLRGSQRETQRVLAVKPNADYREEYRSILQYWVKHEIMFNPEMCGIGIAATGAQWKHFTDNMAYGDMPILREYVQVKDTYKGEKDLSDGGENWEQTSQPTTDDDFLTDFVQE